MGSKTIKNSVGLLILLYLAAACSAATPTIVSPTQFVLPPTQPPSPSATTAPATATPSATLTPQPATATLPPASTNTPAAVVLAMKAGQTEVTAADSLDQNHQPDYLIAAKAGQFMMVSISSTDPSMALQILAPDGSPMIKFSDQKTSWQGLLPLDGNYKVSLASKDGTGSYNLDVVIPVQVKFAAGATSASLDGSVNAHSIISYMIRALQGQTLTVNVDAPGKDVFLTIYGLQDGQPYMRSEMGSSSASIELPTTQDYVVQCVSMGDSDENFKIMFQAK